MRVKPFDYSHPTDDYLSAAILVKGKYLMLRSADDKAFKEEGYFFPGCHARKKLDKAKLLKEQLYLKYGLRVSVDQYIGDVLVEKNTDEYFCMYFYQMNLDGVFTLINPNVKYALLTLKQLNKVLLDKGDRVMVERLNIFRHVYNHDMVTIKRSAKEKGILLAFYDSLFRLNDKVARKDIQDFGKLIQSNASLEEIKKAYIWIVKHNNLDLKKYYKYLRSVQYEN